MSILEDRRFTIELFVAALGISSWVAINGLWTQTPILSTQLPERWTLVSYIVLITQIANIGPLAYGYFREKLKQYEALIIHGILCVGSFAAFLLAIFWSNSVEIFGESRSLPFLGLTFLLAMVDCTSSVLYLPYMAHFKSKYLMAFFIGEGLSGFLPSMVSLFQGLGGNPRCVNATINDSGSFLFKAESFYPEPNFSVTFFCLFLSAVMVFSWISFTILDSPFGDSERVTNNGEESNPPDSQSPIVVSKFSYLNKSQFRYLLFVQAFVSALTNGFLPSIQSYSCAPYGSLAYNLAVKLSGLANPVFSFIAFFYKKRISVALINVFLLYNFIITIYIVITAISSPQPPLQGELLGSILLVFSWVSFIGSSSYIKSCIASLFRDYVKKGHQALFWVGVFTQMGSATGAIVSFLLINYWSIFVSFDPCSSPNAK